MPAIDESRKAAAAVSLGTSSEAIHRAVLGQLIAGGASGGALDFGAGTGSFATRLAASTAFTSVTAVDLLNFGSTTPAEVAWLYADLNAPLPVPEASFDVVCAIEVIEHLENPRFVAREWFRLLKPGGFLIFSTPNNESLRSIISLIARGHFAAFTGASYPAHITALLRADTTRILAECGFVSISHTFSDQGGIPGMPTVSWQSLSGGLLRGCRFSDNFITSARKPR